MPEISIRPELKKLCPGLRLGCILADVLVTGSGDGLLSEIKVQTDLLRKSLRIDEISKLSAIEASRKAYKACGKDPARYRLSAEALLRRIVSGKELYQINNVVDQLNLVSILTGLSIGGYDADKICGDIEFGIGQPDEPYQGIGRGELNIANLPVFRDNLGAFGSPTSDSPRTEVSAETKRFLMVLIGFGGNFELENAMNLSVRLLQDYCSARNFISFSI